MIARGSFFEAGQTPGFKQTAGFTMGEVWVTRSLGHARPRDHQSLHVCAQGNDGDRFACGKIAVHAAAAPVALNLVGSTPRAQ
jgi:hypothetical protein